MKKNKKVFPGSGRVGKFYFASLLMLGAIIAAGFFLAPDFNSSSQVAAQKSEAVVADGNDVVEHRISQSTSNESAEVATRQMIGIAFDLRLASDFTVFADNGISDDGNSRVQGNIGIARENARIKGFTYGNVEGSIRETKDVGGYDPIQTQKDLNQAFSAMKQLPCMEVSNTLISGRTFTPGVYCLASAELAGQMTLDGGNDMDATFVFRVAGSLNAANNSGISLTNGANAYNTFFVVEGDATVGTGVELNASIFAQDNVSLGSGTKVDGRIMSVKGSVDTENVVVGNQTGFIEICKATTGDNAALLANRLFRFRIGGIIREVPVGQCTAPFEVPVGPQVIEELLTGNTTSGGTYNGNFQLVSVQRTNIYPPNPNIDTTLDGVNLPLEQRTLRFDRVVSNNRQHSCSRIVMRSQVLLKFVSNRLIWMWSDSSII